MITKEEKATLVQSLTFSLVKVFKDDLKARGKDDPREVITDHVSVLTGLITIMVEQFYGERPIDINKMIDEGIKEIRKTKNERRN